MTREAHSSLSSAAAAAARAHSPQLPRRACGKPHSRSPDSCVPKLQVQAPLTPEGPVSAPQRPLCPRALPPSSLSGVPQAVPGSPERPLCLPSALPAHGSGAWAGHAVAQDGLGPRGKASPPLSRRTALPSACSGRLPCWIPALGRRHLRFLPHPSPPPFSLRFLPGLGEHGSGSWRSRGGGRRRGGVRARWVGREPRGCGLAATLQLVAGDPTPPACLSDGGEDIRLDTHTRAHTAGHVSRRQPPGAGRRPDSSSRGEPGAHTAWPRRLQDPGREDPSRTGCRSFRQIGRKQAARGPVTADAGGSSLGAQSPGQRRCRRGERRMLTSARRASAGPGSARTPAPAAAPAVPAPRERAQSYLPPASPGSAGNAP